VDLSDLSDEELTNYNNAEMIVSLAKIKPHWE
jgi:hypothetical protein